MQLRGFLAAVLALSLAALPGCSVRQYAVNRLGDALVSGNSAYASDDDVVLVGEALPFSLKLVESLLAESPRHRGLLTAASQGFVLYSYGYVHFDAERLADEDLTRARALSRRAKKLYLRAHDYALRGLEVCYPGFRNRLQVQPERAVQQVGSKGRAADVALLYWTAASLGLAVSADRQDTALLARMPEVDALLARTLQLDEAWNGGALHEFALTWSAARPGFPDERKIEQHYARALELSRGKRAGVYVAYAEAVSVRRQDRAQFQDLLHRALAVDLNADPDNRLVNTLAQRRAQWLLGRTEQLFLE
jgi:predicted anti-sigma-YlaC factor YlaD